MNLLLKSACLAALLTTSIGSMAQQSDPVMWYQRPAKEWMEASPIGNGRLGAMIFGGITNDRIALNEITLWAGQRDDQQNDHCGPEHLAEIRKAFFDGDMGLGNQLARQYLNGHSLSFGTHLPMGEMTLTFDLPEGNLKDYRRQLDLEKAVATTTFNKGGVNFTREYFCDYPDSVIVVRLTADKPGNISVTVGTKLLREATHTPSAQSLDFGGKVDYPMFGPGGVEFFSTTRILPKGGKVTPGDNSVKVENADEVVLITDIRTDMFNPDYKALAVNTVDKAAKKGYDALKSTHIADVTPLFNRMSIKLGTDDNSSVPTDVRLHLIKNGAIDTDFDALFFQYGRYMQIASSRPGSPLCSNLQGVWNDDLACHMGWTCDYHLDININQNYWSANKANLAECNEALFTYVKLLEKYGSETASKLYGCKGWCAHTITNPWGFTAPGGDIGWGLCVSAGAWLATELWSHYLYTLDTDYLRNTGYPLLKSCAEFYMDYMVEDPNTGYLVTGPSISPENAYRLPDGSCHSASMMPTLDLSVVRQIYTACIESSKILNVDKKMRQRLEKDMARLPNYSNDSRGQLKEWLHESERQDPSHRHSSHLHCMYPFGQISYTKSPELMEGVRASLVAQTSDPNWENTEWSCGNMLCFYSFLKDGDKAHYYLQDLFHTFTRENLMTVSPKGIAGAPEDIFSFDATEASVAGICDMLLQSFDGFIEFLPALPAVWADGSVRGVCAQGDIQADLDWKDSKLTNATLRAGHDGKYIIKLPDYGNPVFTLNGQKYTAKVKDGMAEISLKANDILTFSI